MKEEEPNLTKVYIVDDDIGIREAMTGILTNLGLAVEKFESAEDFLSKFVPGSPGCMLLDITMPGLSGPELQIEIKKRGWQIPIVLVSGDADVNVTVQTMEAGAVAVLEKPFDSKELVTRVFQALDLDSQRRAELQKLTEFKAKQDTLTPRENQVMDLIVGGLLSKQIAYELGTSERTIGIHRSRVMKKMKAETVADLTAMCVRNDITGS